MPIERFREVFPNLVCDNVVEKLGADTFTVATIRPWASRSVRVYRINTVRVPEDYFKIVRDAARQYCE